MTAAIRRATAADAADVARVLNSVIAEGQHTILDRAFSVAEEREFLSALGARDVVHLAIVDDAVVGVQSVSRFSTMSDALSHVATMGTWIDARHRGEGIGRSLADASLRFAVENGYSKIVIYVLADNERALGFYRSLGFAEIGIARNQARLGGQFQDEVFLEKHLSASGQALSLKP